VEAKFRKLGKTAKYVLKIAILIKFAAQSKKLPENQFRDLFILGFSMEDSRIILNLLLAVLRTYNLNKFLVRAYNYKKYNRSKILAQIVRIKN
jgi:hypothetical protein